MPQKIPYPLIRLQQPEAQLLDGLERLHRGLISPHQLDKSAIRFLAFITKRLTDEDMLLALALDREIAIGYSLAFDVVEHPFMPEWQRAGYLTQFFVMPDYRGQGVGQQLFDFTTRWLSQRGVTSLFLNVEADNPLGTQFWQKQGFVYHTTRMKRKA